MKLTFYELAQLATRIRELAPRKQLVPEASFWIALDIHARIVRSSKTLFESRHYAQATREAMQVVEKRVRELAKLETTGVPMMRTAFSSEKPRLRFTTFKGLSARDEQDGYMQIFAGSIGGVRNPRSHEPTHIDEELTCKEFLILASHLVKKAESATKCRSPKSPKTP